LWRADFDGTADVDNDATVISLFEKIKKLDENSGERRHFSIYQGVYKIEEETLIKRLS
jgi:hypothetical protein